MHIPKWRYGSVLILMSVMVLIMVLQPQKALAQLQGRITEVHTGLPLPQSDVLLYHRNGEVYQRVPCKPDGSFNLLPKPGRSTLVVLCSNYLMYKAEIRYHRKEIWYHRKRNKYFNIKLIPAR